MPAVGILTPRKGAYQAMSPKRANKAHASSAVAPGTLPTRYVEACRLAEQEEYGDARRLYLSLASRTAKSNTRFHALIQNDLAVLYALEASPKRHCERGTRRLR